MKQYRKGTKNRNTFEIAMTELHLETEIHTMNLTSQVSNKLRMTKLITPTQVFITL